MLIENFRPGLMRELGLALDDLRTRNPRLITCSLTAFGDDAPEATARPATYRASPLQVDERDG